MKRASWCLTGFALTFFLGMGVVWAETRETVDAVVHEARELLDDYRFQAALDLLDHASQRFPDAAPIHKMHGDVSMILRRNQEAVISYRKAVELDPEGLEARWALWVLLNRLSADPEETLHTLREIVRLDARNPLAHLRLGRTLHEAKRYEESVAHFRRAVELAPENAAFHLFLSRALFDILDSTGAQYHVQWVLDHAARGSPAWVAAQNLSQVVRGETSDRGARSDFFETTKEPYGDTGKDYKTWALTREKAWRHMKSEEYARAEALWRQVLVLDPQDDIARYHLGLTLMKLRRYEEAIEMLKRSLARSSEPPFVADALFQIGRGYSQLEQWREAIPYFQAILAMQDRKDQDFYAMNFPDIALVQAALDRARRRAGPGTEDTALPLPLSPPRADRSPSKIPDGSLSRELQAPSLLEDRDTWPAQVLPIGVDSVRGWFRELITARMVVRDDLQTGSHEFIPLSPGDSFSPDQSEIYLVFALTTPPSVATTITSQWVAEQANGIPSNTVIGTDTVAVGLNDATGYFVLDRPANGWPIGMYRIDLFTGDAVSAYTHIADVRFRIVAPAQ